MCYVITPHTHQWYKINANKILENHILALCDDQSAQMVPLPPEINAYTSMIRLTLVKSQDGQINGNCNQPMYNNMPLVNQYMNGPHQSQYIPKPIYCHFATI